MIAQKFTGNNLNTSALQKLWNILLLICFGVVCVANMWALWSTVSILDTLYSLASMGIFAIGILLSFNNINKKVHIGRICCYACFVIWSVIMMFAFDVFYPVHGDKTFLIFTMDSYALSFIRMLIVIVPCMIFIDEYKIPSKYVDFIILIILISGAFLMTRAIIVDPDAVRARGTMQSMGYGELLVGVPDYGQVYGMSVLIPFFLYRLKNKHGKEKVLNAVILALMSYIVVFSQFATALLIALCGVLIYYFIISENQKRLLIAILGIILLWIVLFMDGGADIFRWLSNKTTGAWSIKLEDIALTLSGQQDSGMVSSRVDHYSHSIAAFKSSPFFGMFVDNSNKIGGHATVIDVLGLTGIFGFIFFGGSIYANYFRMSKLCYSKEARAVAITSTISFLLLACLKNLISAIAIFLSFYVIIPFLLKTEEEDYETVKKDAF